MFWSILTLSWTIDFTQQIYNRIHLRVIYPKLYSKKLPFCDNVNSPSEIISTQCASLRPLVQVKEFDINFDDHWHDEILHELHNKKPLKLTQDHKSSQVKISPTDCKLNLMPGHADWLDQKDKKKVKKVFIFTA